MILLPNPVKVEETVREEIRKQAWRQLRKREPERVLRQVDRALHSQVLDLGGDQERFQTQEDIRKL